MDMLNQKQKIIAIIGIAVVIVIIGYYYINSTKEVYTTKDMAAYVETEENTIKEEVVNNEKEKTIMVHITGAVKRSGVVEVKEDSRINDAIEAAGGITDEADLEEVNLAYKIEDGQKIYIPRISDKNNKEVQEEKEIVTEESGNNVIKEEIIKNNNMLININTAGIAELMRLSGIGESTANKIIEYRKANGKFKTIEEIKNVPGIGDAKFNAIKDAITV